MIITHQSVDWDAVGAVWLLQRFAGLDSEGVSFVNTGAPDEWAIEHAVAVVDTGRVYDPERLRFDHHQLPGVQASLTSATEQVFTWLLAKGRTDLWYLAPLVNLITAADCGLSADGADWSRKVGLHALLSGHILRTRMQGLPVTDWAVMMRGKWLLDDLAAHLESMEKARASLATHKVYESQDGLVVALDGAPPASSAAAFELGAALVVYHSEFECDGQTSHSIGVQRRGEMGSPNVGALVEQVTADFPALAPELATWYKHEGQWFAGRGSRKAPVFRPVEVDLAQVACAIDAVWER